MSSHRRHSNSRGENQRNNQGSPGGLGNLDLSNININQIASLLNNIDLNQLSSLLGGFNPNAGGGPADVDPPQPQAPPPNQAQRGLGNIPPGDKSLQLLHAIRPMVSSERAEILDMIIQLYSIGKILRGR